MRRNKPPITDSPKKQMKISAMASVRAGMKPDKFALDNMGFSLQQTFTLPEAPTGVIPSGVKMAMDNAFAPYSDYGLTSIFEEGLGFMGYPYLAQLAQRSEYRKPCEIIAKEMTRKWLKFVATGDEDKSEKIKQLEDEFKRLDVKELFYQVAEQDGLYGRSQLYIDLGDKDPEEIKKKLVKSKTKVGKGSIKKLRIIEPYWTYPSIYNSTDPLNDDFFKPTQWFVMGKEIHCSRFLTFVSRPVSDILKPVYNFGGLSLTQILKPYVDNWLRTRQSVSDLLHSFSTSVLKTDLSSILGGGDGEDVGTRVDIFNKYRDNRGCFVLDKNEEDFLNVSAPLGTLDKLQAQAQEQMASAAGIPLIILLKITPSGLNASSDGEIRTFNDWIESQQVSLFDPQLETLIPLVQLSLWGEIDPEITHQWEPLNVKDETIDANVRKIEADTDVELVNAGIIDTSEARTRLTQQEDSPYAGLDLSVVPEPPGGEMNEFGEFIKDPARNPEWYPEDENTVMDGGPGSGVKGHTTAEEETSGSKERGFDPLSLLMSPQKEKYVDHEANKIISTIDNEIKKQKAIIDDWKNRKYKSNSKVVNVGGKQDDLNSGEASIGAANERRRKNTIRNAEKVLASLEKTKGRVSREDLNKILDDVEEQGFEWPSSLGLRK